MRPTLVALALVALGSSADPVRAEEQPQTLKIATLAPEGSSWVNLLHAWGRAVEEHTSGKVKVKFFAGGVAGDERDFVKKMKLGQLNGAVVTGIGLGLMASDVRVLELPMLFNDYTELDYVRNALHKDFAQRFEAKGYELLSWGDVGPVHIFSNIPIKERGDFG